MSAPLAATSTSTPPLSIDAVTGGQRATPGNVGVCLSGGGSRACSAGMGQLRALKHLQANGKSLLSQVKAISTVSGGSWLGVPFTFLPSSVSDDEYLNEYVSDPGDLVLSDGPSTAVTLDQLPAGNIGHGIASRRFSVPALAVQAFLLWKTKDTPANMLWQTLMGMHLLAPFGLYKGDDNGLPTSFFTVDSDSLEAIRRDNSALRNVVGHRVASGTDRTSRPYLICNTAMFVDVAGVHGEPALVPVQATPYFTGVVSHPENATDTNLKLVGGGGVTSFAFNSELTGIDQEKVTVSQSRQWSITDIVGSSSAAFAGDLEEILQDPEKLLDHLVEHFEQGINWIMGHLGLSLPFDLSDDTPDMLKRGFLRTMLHNFELDAGGIIPAYDYWPVRDASPQSDLNPTRFADGGNLENTGICGLLSYTDIDSVIAFVNSSVPMVAANRGVMDSDGNEIPDTKIKVDNQIPPLFGYQPYDDGSGYQLYPSDSDSFESRSQVFDSNLFPDLLQQLWKNSGNEIAAGSNATPAICQQTLTTMQNDWFGIDAGRDLTVVWCYLNDVAEWRNALNSDVQKAVSELDDFPNYKTFDTNLSETQINLLASLTAWSVGNAANRSTFTSLFE